MIGNDLETALPSLEGTPEATLHRSGCPHSFARVCGEWFRTGEDEATLELWCGDLAIPSAESLTVELPLA